LFFKLKLKEKKKVTYVVASFLDKNRDTLRAEWMTALQSSKNRFVATLFAPEDSNASSSDDLTAHKTLSRGGGGRRGGSKVPTVSSQFHSSLIGLLALLSTCNPYFVRCIKPNSNKQPNEVFKIFILLDNFKLKL